HPPPLAVCPYTALFRSERALDIYVIGLYVAPVSALTPLFIFWLGIDLAPRVATVFVFAVPQVIITCFRGARSTPRTHIQVARSRSEEHTSELQSRENLV